MDKVARGLEVVLVPDILCPTEQKKTFLTDSCIIKRFSVKL